MGVQHELGDRITAPSIYDPPPAVEDRPQAILAGELVLCWDVPEVGAQLELPAMIAGWAYSRRWVEEVWVVIDGEARRATANHPRPEVAQAFEEPAATLSGFWLVLHRDSCPPGPHEVTVIAVDRDGHAVGETRTLDVLEHRDAGAAAAVNGTPLPPPTRRLDGNGERYVPEVYAGTAIAAQHECRFAWAAELGRDREVLDAACGVGVGTRALLSAGARRVVGIDLDQQALDSARERCGETGEFVAADVTTLPFEDRSFDLVVSFETVEHIEDPLSALDEFARVLRDDGLLVLSTPNRDEFPEGNPFHLHELSSGELEQALRDRFTNVAMYRQQDYFGSLLLDDRQLADDDPSSPFEVDLRKLHGSHPGEEMFSVAVAGNVDLPSMSPIGFLGAPISFKALTGALMLLSQAALESQARATAAIDEANRTRYEESLRHQEDLDAARRARLEAERWLAEHRNSLTWRLTEPLRVAKRLMVAWLRSR